MFTVLCPQYVGIYVRLGAEERVPVLLVRQAEGKQMLPDGPQLVRRLAAFCALAGK